MENIYSQAFGKNDIRGVYGKDITEILFYNIGRSFIKYLSILSGKNPADMYLTLCMDARTHSPSLAKAFQAGVTSMDANVIDLGLAPTPIGYYSETVGVSDYLTKGNNVIAACIITASHNPKEYNGLKITYCGKTLNESQIKDLRDITLSDFQPLMSDPVSSKIQKYNIIPDYIEEMVKKFGQVGKGVKVVVDSANATGGIVGPELYRRLGCEVVELFSEPDGTFPNHHPNPSVESTLDTLKSVVKSEHADIGIAFDGDSDRIGIIDNLGGYLTGDKLLLIYASDVIPEYNKRGIIPHVISEVKCSQVLFDTIDKIGGKSHMCKTGHGYVKSMMYETGAVLAGEIHFLKTDIMDMMTQYTQDVV